ncbi:MAG: hypothetical protein A3B37_00670 [Candidatus Sungbacteria bacterium RIFCSPLOWO2_01_FULL_59_16]|uniref:Right handed beta helix domain-containing protein n=1 Tax=Candidatus Sungbacteria bacterium RIFCSPLOWO2_01_FULL_59_16 TaxID=1802280 RepID=A0A1G2LB56_9BACT|nr:MAG: hypothetical protein A3B37_00670 [Candidatus Sungbacteria bacterium RIFCSPLOWO2_01_FULL_59_16]
MAAFVLLLLPSGSRAVTILTGTIGQDTTLTAADSPYVVQDAVTVNAGITLAIEPNTVVKFESDAVLNMYGVIRANGLDQNRVTFTSIKDDSIGGDTNGDGSAASPAPGDWGYIGIFTTGPAASELRHADIRYGGGLAYGAHYPALVANSASMTTVSDSEISQNPLGVFTPGNLTLVRSRLRGNGTAVRYQSSGGRTLALTENEIADNANVGVETLPGSGNGVFVFTGNAFRNNPVPLAIHCATPISHAGNAASGSAKNGIALYGTNCAADVTWGSDAIPYIIQGDVYYRFGSVTVAPGAVIKFDSATSTLTVHADAAFTLDGTEAEPITFTSIKDDSVGGDTNGDGGATSPAPGDWGYVLWGAGSWVNRPFSMSHVRLRYGGAIIGDGTHPMLILSLSSPGASAERSLEHVEISSSPTGLYARLDSDARLRLTNADFHDNETALEFVGSRRGALILEASRIAGNSRYGVNVRRGGGTFTFNGNTFLDNAVPVFAHGNVPLAHANNTASGSDKNGIVLWGSDLSAPGSLNADSMPYIVEEQMYYRFGTLAIDPGAVFKFSSSTAGLLIHSDVTLQVNGTRDRPVIFTSIKDDSVGGDTNGDGDTTMPAPGDWGDIAFSANRAGTSLRFAKVRYGGGQPRGGVSPAVNAVMSAASATEFTFTGLEFSHNRTGLSAVAIGPARLVIAESSFRENSEYGLYSPAVSGQIVLDARNNWWGDPSGPFHPTLNASGAGDRVSDRVDFAPWLAGDPFPPRDPVIIVPGILGSWLKNGRWVLDPILHIYDNLWEALELAGYERDQTLFFLGYDFRQDNAQSARELKAKIAEMKGACGCAKVDVIAHSMGGIIARQYAESDDYAGDIDQLIFLGTPHKGAPKAYLAWEGGEMSTKQQNLGFDFQDAILTRLFRDAAKKNGFENIFDYIRNRPILSIEQLLPIYSYLLEESTANLREYPDNYPQNLLVEELNRPELLEKLTGGGIRITNIAGKIENTTVGGYSVINSPHLPKWEHGYPNDFYSAIQFRGMFFEDGDETVPFRSSIDLLGITPQILASRHSALPTDAQLAIIKELTGKEPAAKVERFRIPIKAFMIRIFSPITAEITDPLGRKIGTEPETSEEVNEIPGAFYSGPGANGEFFLIPEPLDGEYGIAAKGTAAGAYTIAVGYLSDGNEVETSVSGNTEPNLEINYALDLAAEDPDPVTVEPEDAAPPTTTVALSGAIGANNWFTSEVEVTLAAEDNAGGVGVFQTEYSLDAGQSWNSYAAPFGIAEDGAHHLLYRSRDFVANSEPPKEQEVKIDTTAPEARIRFNPDAKALIIEGMDAMSSTTVSRTGNAYAVADEAGHTLALAFKKLAQGAKSITAELQGLQYDGGAAIQTPKTELRYAWTLDANQATKTLNQNVSVAGRFTAKAGYSKAGNKTTITIQDLIQKKKQKVVLNGLAILHLITRAGNLDFEY